MRRHVWSMNIAYPTNPNAQRLDGCGGWKWFSLTCSALKCSCFRTSEAPPTKHPEAPPTKVKHPKAPPTEVKHQRPRPASLSACCRLSRRRLLSGCLKRKKEVVCVCACVPKKDFGCLVTHTRVNHHLFFSELLLWEAVVYQSVRHSFHFHLLHQSAELEDEMSSLVRELISSVSSSLSHLLPLFFLNGLCLVAPSNGDRPRCSQVDLAAAVDQKCDSEVIVMIAALVEVVVETVVFLLQTASVTQSKWNIRKTIGDGQFDKKFAIFF